MSRPHYSAEVREYALSSVLDSHTPITQVAQEVGCSPCTLHSWLKKHRQQNAPPNDQTSRPSFIPINVVDSAQPVAEIVLPNGITIRLTNITPHSIADLLHVLASSC